MISFYLIKNCIQIIYIYIYIKKIYNYILCMYIFIFNAEIKIHRQYSC